jgi:hypothetical protein
MRWGESKVTTILVVTRGRLTRGPRLDGRVKPGHDALRAFRLVEALRLDQEHAVQPRAVILHRDRGGKLDQLRVGEMLLRLREQRIRNRCRRCAQPFGNLQRDAFGRREQLRIPPVADRGDLFV